MSDKSESLIATRKFARVLGNETDKKELSIETAGEWARNTLNAYKVFGERELDQNVYKLVTPEALETLQEVLWDAGEYKLEVEYPVGIVATGGMPAQKTATRTWIIRWLEGLMKATSTAAVVPFQKVLAQLLKCRLTGRDGRGQPGRRYTSGHMMRLKLGVKRVASKCSKEDKAAANPKWLLKIVWNIIALDRTREY